MAEKGLERRVMSPSSLLWKPVSGKQGSENQE